MRHCPEILDRCEPLSTQDIIYGRIKKRRFVAVYKEMPNIGDIPNKVVRSDASTRRNTLFVVKYLEWNHNTIYPSGYVCRVIHNGHNPDESRLVLDLLHEIRVEQIPDKIANVWRPTEACIKAENNREDLRHLTTIAYQLTHRDALSL